MRLFALTLAALPALYSQKLDPIQWSAAGQDGFLVEVRVKMDPGWHLYSLTTPRPPIATTAKVEGVEVESYQPAPTKKLDPNFGVQTETFEGEVSFYLKGAGPMPTAVNVRYQACDDKQCLPPRRKTVEVTKASAALAIPSGHSKIAAPAASPASSSTAPPPAKPAEQGLGQFLAIAFGFGLAAIFTPCVFPMIPITMSFFLGQSEGRSRGQQIAQALIFCLGIVFLFTLLGFSLTALLGPFGVVQIASNPWVNSFIAAIFVALAFSLFGAYEIQLPSGLLTKLNAASNSGGTIGTLLMGLTFSLTSFACVGPFVGTLLAASVSENKLQPTLGMMSFASGLALPFFFLALFPSVLQKLPRSGAWMMRIKIVFGFVILAAALKYLANVDQVLQWGFLTRERFIAAWFVLFTLPGLYLLGLLPMEGIKRDEPVGVGRLLTGAAFAIFAFSLLPGMFGGKLGELDAYVPLAAESSVASPSGEKLAWMKNDLPGALAKAKAEGKLVFVNFTGYACTNCHWMKANMFPRPEIREALSKFVLVEIYTDGADAVSEANQKMQETKFQTVAIPLYAILDADERVVATFPGITKDPAEYLAFLNRS
ncbi:MAG: cytochrome c biogenesis protein CcdA [Bryobacteraceae bacterium]|nr:cytochrome c biogenesis protein CcdA [Bryobacteraceae bacterium]